MWASVARQGKTRSVGDHVTDPKHSISGIVIDKPINDMPIEYSPTKDEARKKEKGERKTNQRFQYQTHSSFPLTLPLSLHLPIPQPHLQLPPP